jgi:hypothetical protein
MRYPFVDIEDVLDKHFAGHVDSGLAWAGPAYFLVIC